MTPQEKCVSLLAALARSDARGAAAIASSEIDVYLQSVGDEAHAAGRALNELAFRLSMAAPATATALEIDEEIKRRMAALGAGGGRPPDPA